jgi:hypothetical protein
MRSSFIPSFFVGLRPQWQCAWLHCVLTRRILPSTFSSTGVEQSAQSRRSSCARIARCHAWRLLRLRQRFRLILALKLLASSSVLLES